VLGSVVKLVYDAQFDAYNSYAYAYNDMILDLNGYAVNVFDGYGYLRVYGKLTVIDTSDDQKGGIKMKPEMMYGGKLELMAGRYIYTADEINTNGYNGYGFVAENINTDASADADGYISKLRPMTAEEKSVAGYNKSKTAFKFTLEGIGSTEMSVIKNQEIRLTPPAGWKFGKILQGENEFWGGYWENNTYIINASSVNDYLGEIIANVIPDPNKLVDQLKGITLTQSDDKTSVSLKGAGGKTVVLYSENGATLMTQQVEIYKRATFKGLATGKIYYIGVDDMLVKVDTNL
jgi:hypothetical protein